MGLDLLVASLINFIINFYILLFYVRIFLAESERYDAVLGMVFRATDPILGLLGTTLRWRGVNLAPLFVIVVLLLLKGMIWGSIPRTLQSFADTLFVIYVFIIIVIAGYHEYYINPIATFGQRMVSPIRTIAANFTRHLVTVNVLSAAILVILHSIVTLILSSMMGDLAAVSVQTAIINSLGLIVDLTWYFIIVIVINALLTWVSPDPLNPVVQLLALISAPIVGPIRRYIPPLAGTIDLSPIIAIIMLNIANSIGHNVLSLLS